jgi:hypothetical protein
LVFFLGGLPEEADLAGDWIPAGFHADPTFPFKQGLPRTEPLFKFVPDRVVRAEPHPDAPNDPSRERYLRYYPDGVDMPYVYFRARRYRDTTLPSPRNISGYADYDPNSQTVRQLGYVHSVGNPAQGRPPNICVPYREEPFREPPYWRNQDTCQIITAGADEQFGTMLPFDPNSGNVFYRITRIAVYREVDNSGNVVNEQGWPVDGDYDNLANFAKRTLEDELK